MFSGPMVACNSLPQVSLLQGGSKITNCRAGHGRVAHPSFLFTWGQAQVEILANCRQWALGPFLNSFVQEGTGAQGGQILLCTFHPLPVAHRGGRGAALPPAALRVPGSQSPQPTLQLLFRLCSGMCSSTQE